MNDKQRDTDIDYILGTYGYLIRPRTHLAYITADAFAALIRRHTDNNEPRNRWAAERVLELGGRWAHSRRWGYCWNSIEQEAA